MHQSNATLVPMSTAGARRPLYVVHGGGGGILFLKEFAQLLEGTRQVWGFRARGIDGSRDWDPNVEAMAARYVEALIAVDPGPYLLGGYSFGGTIVLEMVNQLKALGREVTDVILFDCWPGGDYASQPRLRRHLRLLRFLVTDGYGPVREYVKFITGNRVKGRTFADEPERDDDSEFFWMNFEMFARYRYPQYDVDTVLIKAELNWPGLPRDYRWQQYLTRPLDIRIAKGHHITMWWREYAPALVALFEDVMASRETANDDVREHSPV